MGKRSKNPKKARRAAEAAERAAKLQQCAAAAAVPDVLEPLAAFRAFEDLSVEYARAADLAPETRDRLMALTEANMRQMYEESGWGWDDAKKREELFHEDARVLLAVDGSGGVVGFLDLRFCLNDDDVPGPEARPVLYVYELQVALEAQRRGLGKRLMQIAELVARGQGMVAVMLTVFRANEPAMAFYLTKMRYEVDEDSPSRHLSVEEAAAGSDEPYEILSKTFPVSASAASAASAGGASA